MFNLAECLAWLREQGRDPLAQPDAERPEDGTKSGVELKLKREKARLAELERLEREGALHDIAECKARRVQQLWTLKREFMALPRSLAPEMEGQDRTKMEEILTKRIVAILEAFARGDDDGKA